MAKKKVELLELAGREVSVTNPDKIYYPVAGHTKLDLVKYYLAVAEGAMRGIVNRPMVLRRYVDGAAGEGFFQKRAPDSRPEWIETITIRFPSGRTAEEVVVRDLAQLIWVVNLGCLDLNPHPVRTDELELPDELRVDLDPGPGVPWSMVRDVALVVRDALEEVGLRGFPKTSGSRGMHVYVRIAPRWGFDDVRLAALALARDVEKRAPELATSKWWKEERHGVFIDYNQNAKDRTVASVYSVRPVENAQVSAPLTWDEVATCDPAAYTLVTMQTRFAERGDVGAGIDDAAGDLTALLALAQRQRDEGMEDAAWPPHYPKGESEPSRVQPSRARKGQSKKVDGKKTGTGRRVSKMPLLVIAKAAAKQDALEGLERWKARHPNAATHLHEDDVLVDAMRGKYKTWTRIRVNLRHVPEELRPPEEPPDPDYEPFTS